MKLFPGSMEVREADTGSMEPREAATGRTPDDEEEASRETDARRNTVMLRGEPTKHDWLDESSASLEESLWKLVVDTTRP